MIRKEVRFTLAKAPGAFARVALALAKAGVNIEAISSAATADRGETVRLLVSDVDATTEMLRAHRIPCEEERVVVMDLENRPGALATLAAKLARAGVAIDAMYGSKGDREGVFSRLVISSSDPEHVETLIR